MPPEPLRILLVDDEPLVRRGLCEYLATAADIEVVGEAGDGFAAVQQIEALAPQLVFLDVQMPGLDGFEVLQQLEPGRRPAVVFVTAHEQYALRAFEVHAVDYLCKPFDEARFHAALARARQRLASDHGGVTALLDDERRRRRTDRFIVKHAGRLRIVPAGEIEWIEARGNYVHLHHPEGPFLLRETMVALQQALPPATFVRVHRSAIVALRAVADHRRLQTGDFEIRLHSGATVPMSRSHRAAFLQALRGP